MKNLSAVACSVFAILLASPSADAADIVIHENKWEIGVGAGLVYGPAFVGSEDYQLRAYPDISIKYGDSFFASVREGVGYNFHPLPELKMGPIVKYDFGRDEDGDSPFRVLGPKSDALAGLGDVDGTIEVGGFAEYVFSPFNVKLEVRQGVNGHEGLLGEASVNFFGSSEKGYTPRMSYSIGPRIVVADQEYINAYYGIDATQSVAAGLPTYDAEAGIVSYGLGFSLTRSLGKSMALSFFGGYDFFGDEVKNSPLVEELGKDEQFMVGVGLSYRLMP